MRPAARWAFSLALASGMDSPIRAWVPDTVDVHGLEAIDAAMEVGRLSRHVEGA